MDFYIDINNINKLKVKIYSNIKKNIYIYVICSGELIKIKNIKIEERKFIIFINLIILV